MLAPLLLGSNVFYYVTERNRLIDICRISKQKCYCRITTEVRMTQILDSETFLAFRRRGFVVINELIPNDEVLFIKDTLLRLHDTNAGYAEGAQFDAIAGGGGGGPRFPQILGPSNYAPGLTKTRYHQLGLQIARQMLGDKARFDSDISFFKPAKIGSDTPWHQDEAFGNPAFDGPGISIWLAVTDANATNSCMSFIPGSQEYPVLEHRPVGGNPKNHALECTGDFDVTTAVECPLTAGSCTVHTHRTLHYAGPNPSDRPRLGYALIFDVPPVLRAEPRDFPWRAQQSTDRAARQRTWQRRGGILLYLWRRRRRWQFRLLVEARGVLKRVLTGC
jgi:hypothetical protein